MRIHCFQHVPFEGLGSIADWIQDHGHQLSVTQFYRSFHLPDVHAMDALIVMGGPMGVNDEAQFPWLVQEKKFIAAFIALQKPLLGICLGSQLIAAALGAPVYPNRYKEIGWFPVALTPEGKDSPLLAGVPPQLNVFHWHGDTYDLPAQAVLLASSRGCIHQAFLYREKVLGLQFHLEVTRASILQIAQNGAHELTSGRYIQKAAALTGNPQDIARVNRVMRRMLDRHFSV